MTTRPCRRRFRSDWQADPLEARNLMDAGAVGAAPVVLRDMGSVSRGAVLAGAEATASIDPGGAVTFRFTLEVGGNYTLRVRHDGDGLSLMALTPAGAAAIDPGPAGPFRAVDLELSAATYEVSAMVTATEGRPVFVDWDLLLNSGVGQASALAAPAPVLALPPAASASTLAAPPAATPVGASPAAGAFAGAVVAELPAQPLAYPLDGPAMGRAGLGPKSPPGPVAPAPGSPSFAATTIAVNLTGLIRPLDPTDPATAAVPGDGKDNGPKSAQVAGLLPVPAPDWAEPVEAGDLVGEAWGPLDAIAPGLCIGTLAVAVDIRRRRRRRSLGLAASAPPRELVRELVGRAGSPAPRPPLNRPILPPLPGAAD